ncbi:hypothetical protein ACFQO4_18350 [Saliphagus sp. GCM10025334]
MSQQKLVSILAQKELEGVPEARIKSIIDATPNEQRTGNGDLPLSQAPSTDAVPRDPEARVLSADDLEYLSRREFARVIGLALEQFEGNTVRPAVNQDVAVDLYWHRQQQTVGLRMAPTTGDLIGLTQINAVVDGTVRVEDTRSPSELAVVTNGTFSDRATELASEENIFLFDGGHVETWFRHVALSPPVVGTILEEGENHDGPLDDLVDIPSIPAPRQQIDPFEVSRARAFNVTVLEFDEDDIPADNTDSSSRDVNQKVAKDHPLGGGRAPDGERGVLYADPDEDGDYEAFDDYLEGF